MSSESNCVGNGTSGQLIIDRVFRGLCRDLSSDEREALRASIIAEGGAREPIIVWRGVIIDGHCRYDICCDLELPFQTREMEFSDRAAAVEWIKQNQLGRRNLDADGKAKLRKAALRYLAENPGRGGDRKSNGHDDRLINNTAKAIADTAGVSEKTLRREADFLKAKDRICSVMGAEFGPIVERVRDGYATWHVLEVAKLPPDRMRVELKKPPRKPWPNEDPRVTRIIELADDLRRAERWRKDNEEAERILREAREQREAKEAGEATPPAKRPVDQDQWGRAYPTAVRS